MADEIQQCFQPYEIRITKSKPKEKPKEKPKKELKDSTITKIEITVQCCICGKFSIATFSDPYISLSTMGFAHCPCGHTIVVQLPGKPFKTVDGDR